MNAEPKIYDFTTGQWLYEGYEEPTQLHLPKLTLEEVEKRIPVEPIRIIDLRPEDRWDAVRKGFIIGWLSCSIPVVLVVGFFLTVL